MLLDNTRFMHAAHTLYGSVGFNEIEPYPESEIPTELRHHLLFMRLSLEVCARLRVSIGSCLGIGTEP